MSHSKIFRRNLQEEGTEDEKDESQRTWISRVRGAQKARERQAMVGGAEGEGRGPADAWVAPVFTEMTRQKWRS